ncbi:hypothetical protein ACFSQU_18050 [Massilia sp. GCM10020059]|uniref:Uncharacterized protein n=1 Tax=Massilia agrisoli TaxID=2892444 RepID=A0ABS8ISQ0_9BURK|nr:hypothetical protein [Massilia agrisoli]MCC6071445.1 hypothetical protein [Massilia agrisoli]
MIDLGRTYKDKITGFEGVATGFVRYISGCNQALLSPRVGGDGALREAQWFDQQRLDPVSQYPVVALDNGASPGCDRAGPKR